MARRNVIVACISLLVLVIYVFTSQPSFAARGPYVTEPVTAEIYLPVAPVKALLRAVRVNLQVTGEWLDDGDFDSAVETVERIKLLLTFCELQSREQSWRARVTLLRSQCDQLISVAKTKDATACIEMSKNCMIALESLGKNPPPDGHRAEIDDLKPSASIRSFMKLLDGSYTDAKLAKSLDELSAMTYAIAEATNIAQFLRSEPEWRERAGDVREAAVKVAKLKADTDLKVARQELKNVYERCQACHKVFRQ
jgi:hypothetical protein